MSAALFTISGVRELQPEWMDQPDIDAAMHRQALAGLARINWWSFADFFLWNRIQDAIRSVSRPLRVLDLACGGGDVLRSLARRARRANLAVTWTGCDVSPTAVEYARRKAMAAGLDEVRHDTLDALGNGPLPECDVAICTLFLHHVRVPQAEQLMRRMANAASRLVLVDDLIRTPAGYLLAWCGGRILSRSPVVHADGPQSVRAAFSFAELKQIAERAGLAGAVVERHWPQRMLLSWERPA